MRTQNFKVLLTFSIIVQLYVICISNVTLDICFCQLLIMKIAPLHVINVVRLNVNIFFSVCSIIFDTTLKTKI